MLTCGGVVVWAARYVAAGGPAAAEEFGKRLTDRPDSGGMGGRTSHLFYAQCDICFDTLRYVLDERFRLTLRPAHVLLSDSQEPPAKPKRVKAVSSITVVALPRICVCLCVGRGAAEGCLKRLNEPIISI